MYEIRLHSVQHIHRPKLYYIGLYMCKIDTIPLHVRVMCTDALWPVCSLWMVSWICL